MKKRRTEKRENGRKREHERRERIKGRKKLEEKEDQIKTPIISRGVPLQLNLHRF